MHMHHTTDPDALVEKVHELTGIDKEVILRILLWELELQNRQYLAPGNYIDFLSDDLADELEYPRSLIHQVLTAEDEIIKLTIYPVSAGRDVSFMCSCCKSGLAGNLNTYYR